MSPAASIRMKWRKASIPVRDLAAITSVTALVWYIIEYFAFCDAFFAWVAANPDYEMDSILLALVFSAFGSAVFAWRRYGEMKAALEAKEVAESHVIKLAHEDPLTGLPNRRALLERLDQLTVSARADTIFTLTIIDLDKFKAVNDTCGHAAGDALLVQATKRLIDHLRQGEEAYRLGGDEFAIISLTPADLGHELFKSMNSLLNALRQPFHNGKFVHHVGASAGTALFPRDGQSAALLRAADIAMYRAKEDGGGLFQVYTEAMD